MTETTELNDQERADELYANRRRRFNAVLDGYECGPGDYEYIYGPNLNRSTSLSSNRLPEEGEHAHHYKPGRWALVIQHLKWGYFVISVADKDSLESRAAQDITEGWQPVCYYDLDQLAGPEQQADEGDVVEYDGATWDVDATDSKTEDGELLRTLTITPRDEDREQRWIFAADAKIIEAAEADERMPVRYTVAKIITVVVFNIQEAS